MGQGPGILPTSGRDGSGTVGLPRSREVLRAGAQRPPASAGDTRHTRAGYRPPARSALGASAFGRLGAYSGVATRGRGPRGGPRRSSSARPGLSLSVALFLPYG